MMAGMVTMVEVEMGMGMGDEYTQGKGVRTNAVLVEGAECCPGAGITTDASQSICGRCL